MEFNFAINAAKVLGHTNATMAALENKATRAASAVEVFEEGEILRVPAKPIEDNLVFEAKQKVGDKVQSFGFYVIVEAELNGSKTHKNLFLSSLDKQIRVAETDGEGNPYNTNEWKKGEGDVNVAARGCTNMKEVLELIAGKTLKISKKEEVMTMKFMSLTETRNAQLLHFSFV